MYYTLRISTQEYADLLTLLNVNLFDLTMLLNQAADAHAIAGYKEQQAHVRTWIHRLSQMEPESEARE